MRGTQRTRRRTSPDQRTRRRTSPDERREQVAALRERLAEWEGEADEETIAEALARFDGYSERNARLIAMQCPDATDVRGFRAWLDAGRCVRKGETSIKILAPCSPRKDEAEGSGEVVAEWTAPGTDPNAPGIEVSSKLRMRFKISHVFDISQTDELPDRASVTA